MLNVDVRAKRNDSSDSHEEPGEPQVPMAMENVMFWTEGFFGANERMNR